MKEERRGVDLLTYDWTEEVVVSDILVLAIWFDFTSLFDYSDVFLQMNLENLSDLLLLYVF